MRRSSTVGCPVRPLRSLSFFLLFLVACYSIFYLTYPEQAYSVVPDYLKTVRPFTGKPSPGTWHERSEKVKAAFVHAYHGYEFYAAPSDELRPVSNCSVDNFNGWGVTAVDSLDTMLLMNLTDEFRRARQLTSRINFDTISGYDIGFFETTIRYLGGLLSAFALSEDPMFLHKAEELAGVLESAFETESGLPFAKLLPKSKLKDNGFFPYGSQFGALAEIGTLQLEYAYLGKVTGNQRYWNHSAAAMNVFATTNLTETGGMLPTTWNISSGQPYDSHLSVGAMADSAHEYLLKMFLLGGKKYKTSLEMYLRATTHIISNLIYLSPRRKLLYVTDVGGPSFVQAPGGSHTQEHLSCFLPGLFALGAHTLPLDDLPSVGIDGLTSLGNSSAYGYAGEQYEFIHASTQPNKGRYSLKDLHMWAAEGLAQTCWLAYADQVSGLAPDEITITSSEWAKDERPILWMDALRRWSGGKGQTPPGVEEKEPVREVQGRDYYIKSPWYLLRPETVESLFIMWKVTGDVKWRERGWQIFEAIEKYTKTGVGYANPRRVDSIPVPLSDEMPSYFLAETLKYLYLLFVDEDVWPLDKWVFNTEAHPLPVVDWTEEELALFI